MIRKYPNHWVITELENVGKLTAGNPAPQEKQYFTNGITPFVRVADLGQLRNSVYIHNTKDKLNKKLDNRLKLYPKGSVLFTKSGMSLLLNQRAILGSDMYVVSHIGIVVPTQEIGSEWIYYWLKTIDFRKYAHATTLPSLKISLLRKMDFPLPPLNEQNRIVEKIEELFSDLDKATEDLKKTQELLKIYRQSVLKAAFEGKLTEEWRKKNISRLVEEVLKIKNENIDELFKIPKSWKWLKVLQIGEVETGTTPRKNIKSNYGQDCPFYKPTDLEAGINVRKAREYLSKKGLSKARFLPKNSILITCIGATIGKTGIIRLPGASNQQINAIIPYKFANPDFIYYQVISPYFQEQIISKSSSTTLPILNKSRFKDLLIVMATKEEQEQIVQETESRLSVCDKLAETVQQSLEKIEYLRQSILKKAFEGKLVPQDPSGEPAEKLLERIIQEKEKFDSNNKKRKKR
jgi:type I restriction enzyme S subunit